MREAELRAKEDATLEDIQKKVTTLEGWAKAEKLQTSPLSGFVSKQAGGSAGRVVEGGTRRHSDDRADDDDDASSEEASIAAAAAEEASEGGCTPPSSQSRLEALQLGPDDAGAADGGDGVGGTGAAAAGTGVDRAAGKVLVRI